MSEEIEEAVREKLKDRAINAIEEGIDNAYQRATDPGGIISGRIPSSGSTAVSAAVGRASCRRYARGEGPQGPLADAVIQPFCGEFLDGIGENPPGGEYEPPFLGGQCPVGYLVNLQNVSTIAPFPGSGQAFANGPIRGIEQTPGILPGTIFVNILANPDIGYRTGNEGEEWKITTVSRLDNQSDNCGNPQDNYVPRTPLPDDGGGTEPINSPGLPPFTISIGPNGDINVEFPGFDGPDRTLPDPFAPVDPTEPPPWFPDDPAEDTEPPAWYGEPPPWFPEPSAPGDNGEPGAPEPVAPGEDAEGEDPDRFLAGVRVDLTVIPDSARLTYLGERAFYSYAYSVLMGGSGGLERDNESAFCPASHFYHSPENANRYQVSFRKGFGGNVIPYWRNPQ